jgi:hypothetical protein
MILNDWWFDDDRTTIPLLSCLQSLYAMGDGKKKSVFSVKCEHIIVSVYPGLWPRIALSRLGFWFGPFFCIRLTFIDCFLFHTVKLKKPLDSRSALFITSSGSSVAFGLFISILVFIRIDIVCIDVGTTISRINVVQKSVVSTCSPIGGYLFA